MGPQLVRSSSLVLKLEARTSLLTRRLARLITTKRTGRSTKARTRNLFMSQVKGRFRKAAGLLRAKLLTCLYQEIALVEAGSKLNRLVSNRRSNVRLLERTSWRKKTMEIALDWLNQVRSTQDYLDEDYFMN